MPRHLRLLGAPRLEDADGSPRDFPLGKPFALLSYLALSTAPVSRDEIARLLWPGSDARRARTSVRQALWFLRKELGPDLFASDDPIALDAGQITTDVAGLEAALADSDLQEAQAHWRGPLLDRFALPDAPEWARAIERKRSELERRFGSLLMEEAARAREAGEMERALELYTRAVDVQPYRDDARAAHIELLIDLRRFDEAEAALLWMRRDLDDDDGRRSADLLSERLHALRRSTPVGDAADGIHLEFVGRSAQLAELLTLWRAAGSGRARTALVTGPAGIGKTRLAREAAGAAGQEGARTLSVKAVEAERTVEWAVMANLVRKLLPLPGAAGVSDASDAALRALVPSMARNGEGNAAVPIRPAALADALQDLIGAVGFESPLVVIVDDLQWADDASRGVLVHVARQLREERCLLLVTCRSGERDVALVRAADGLLTAEGARAIELQPLSEAEVGELLSLAAEFEDDDEAGPAPARIHQLTRGNPLFLVELLRMLEQRGGVEVVEPGRYRFVAGALNGSLPLPASLRETLRLRLEALSDDARAVLARLTRTGSSATLSELEAALRGRSALTRAVAELDGRDLVDWVERDRIGLVHDELRAAVGERLAEWGMDDVQTGRSWRVWKPAAAAALLLGLVASAFVTRAGPDSDVRPYGGGHLFIVTRDSVAELVPTANTPTGWRVSPPDVWAPARRGATVRGPLPTTAGELKWYGYTKDLYDAPDVVEYLPDGTQRLVVSGPGDDGLQAISPDGRFILYVSENLETSYYDQDLYVARADGTEPRLVFQPYATLGEATWSPDGRWITATIMGNPDTIVVLTPLGERVRSVPLRRASVAGWCGSPPRLLVLQVESPRNQLSLLDPESGELREVASDTALLTPACSPDGSAIAYVAIRGGEPRVLLKDLSSGDTREIAATLPGRGQLHWVDTLPPVPTRVRIVRAPDTLEWGERAPLQAELTFSDQSRASGPVEWRSSDPGVASVLSDGRVSANRVGTTELVASTHGWHADTVTMVVTGASAPSVLMRDDFTALDTTRWDLVGWPTPRAGRLDARPALELRGDGRFADGLISREEFALPRGGTLELEFRFRLTRPDRQRIRLCLEQTALAEAGNARQYEDWRPLEWVCFQFPAGELSRFDPREASFQTTNLGTFIRLDPAFTPDRWTHIAVQVRADGKAFLYLDRELVAAAPVRVKNGSESRWRVVVLGAAADTRLYVRNLALWPGPRYEVPEEN